MAVLALKNYFKIGGAQRAAGFAYYAFFSLFPLAILTVRVASLFVDRTRAVHEVIGYFKNYMPLNAEMIRGVENAIQSVVEGYNGMTVLAPLIFFWGAFRFFNVLIRAVNQAWGTQEASWWRVPLRNLLLLGTMGLTLLLGLAVPVAVRVARNWLFSTYDFVQWVFDAAVLLGPLLVLFLGLSLLYRLAPCRPTRFAEVWIAALAVASSLCALESLFVVYLRDFATLNVVYGAFGGMMALLMWIYLSGGLIMLGPCFSAAQAQANEKGWGDPLKPRS